jgi:gliding motility-associated-like protein
MRRFLFKYLLLLVFIFFELTLIAQKNHFVSLTKTDEQCEKASASVQILGATKVDSVAIEWSTGEFDKYNISDLSAANYIVHVKYIHIDSVRTLHDTIIIFRIEKIQCPLLIPRYFSPNGDGYNDFLSIGRIEYFPEFEFIVYNKSGQRVHYQYKNFTPWDGKWLGTNLPDGTYFYVVFYDKKNTSEFMKGDITILR